MSLPLQASRSSGSTGGATALRTTPGSRWPAWTTTPSCDFSPACPVPSACPTSLVRPELWQQATRTHRAPHADMLPATKHACSARACHPVQGLQLYFLADAVCMCIAGTHGRRRGCWRNGRRTGPSMRRCALRPPPQLTLPRIERVVCCCQRRQGPYEAPLIGSDMSAVCRQPCTTPDGRTADDHFDAVMAVAALDTATLLFLDICSALAAEAEGMPTALRIVYMFVEGACARGCLAPG